MNRNINKAIDIFNSEDPVSAILENRDFFPFTPAPIANENDFYAADVPLNFTRAAVEFGLKLQVNGNITDRQHIINGVLGDKAFRGAIADWREKCDQWVEGLKKDTGNETA